MLKSLFRRLHTPSFALSVVGEGNARGAWHVKRSGDRRAYRSVRGNTNLSLPCKALKRAQYSFSAGLSCLRLGSGIWCLGVRCRSGA